MKLLRYTNFISQTFKNSISEFFAYRVDVFMRLFMGILWSIIALAVIELIFYHTPSLNGWSQSDITLLYITINLAFIMQDVLTSSIYELNSHIVNGFFDFIITKPLDSQFFCMFNKPDPGTLIFFFSYNIPLSYSLFSHPSSIHWEYLPLYVILVLAANILWMLMRTVLLTLNFWWQKLDNINQILNSLQDIGRYPTSIFPKSIQIVLYTIFPIAFSSVVPVEVLRGNISWLKIIGLVIVLIIFATISRLLWKKAIKNYSSASS